MKLNFIKEIKNSLDESLSFNLLIFSNGVTVLGVKKIVNYTFTKIVLQTKGEKIIVIEGERLKISQLLEGDLTFMGKIISVRLE